MIKITRASTQLEQRTHKNRHTVMRHEGGMHGTQVSRYGVSMSMQESLRLRIQQDGKAGRRSQTDESFHSALSQRTTRTHSTSNVLSYLRYGTGILVLSADRGFLSVAARCEHVSMRCFNLSCVMKQPSTPGRWLETKSMFLLK